MWKFIFCWELGKWYRKCIKIFIVVIVINFIVEKSVIVFKVIEMVSFFVCGDKKG